VASNNGSVDFRIETSAKFQDVMKQLKGPLGKKLRSDLNKGIRDAAKPIVKDVQSAVLAIDSSVNHGGVGRDASGRFVRNSGSRLGINSGELSRAIQSGSRKVEIGKSHGLRATIARAVKLKITTTGVRIVVDGSALPTEQRNLPQALNKAKGWRHPTFGHEPWVQQSGHPYFDPTILKRADDVRAKIRDVIASITKEV
jgi:hypothetical protein